MTPSVDAFQALARSSPWRWTTLHLRHRSSWLPGDEADLESWLVRPDGVRVIGASGREFGPSGPEQRLDGRPAGPWDPPPATYRPDGLVDLRPPSGSYHDAVLSEGVFWNSYSWLAMLDPVELSHGVTVAHVREDEVAGRPAWRAELTPGSGYNALCPDCCDLLPSRSTAYDVALDVGTGIVVRLHRADGSPDAFWLENDILEAG